VSSHPYADNAPGCGRGTAVAEPLSVLRITHIATASSEGVTMQLNIEGRITRETVGELRVVCTDHPGAAARLRLDLAGVSFVDGDGLALLENLAGRGAELVRGSGFLDTLLEQRRRGGEETPRTTPAGAPPDETALIAGLRAGDADAFETLVRAYGGRMLATARRLLPSEADARDALQDALLSAFRSIASFTGGARLSTWLHRVVVNAALMKLRSRRRRREESIEDLLPRFDETGRFADQPARWATPAEEPLERGETRAVVRRCIAQLPEGHRMVLLLRDVEDLDPIETAAILGVTPNVVKSRLHRARQALKTLLESRGFGSDPARATPPTPAAGCATRTRAGGRAGAPAGAHPGSA
jgi:RNA polymerase sigma-70 factor, ECF subfamily